MGIYIPNMEKPKSCWECRLMDGEANCLVTDEGISFKQEGILPDCPLIEIDENDPMLLEFLNEFTNMRQPINGFCNWGERK